MAILKSLFKGKNRSSYTSSSESNKISLETLEQLIPIRNLNTEKLEAFALEKKTEALPARTVLFKIDKTADSAIYLLQGIVLITDRNGQSYEIEAASTQAKFPLCSGVKYTSTAISKTDIIFLRVSHNIMSVHPDINQQKFIIPDNLGDNRLLQLFSQYFIEEKLEVPSLPNVAIKLRQAMQDDISIADAVKIIQSDAAITAKLIDVANCPLYLTLNPAKSCLDAVNRIGLNATRNLVVSFSLKQIFTNSAKDIKKYLDYYWKESLTLSCLSYVLAAESKQKKPEEALLAGLICDIGVIPFLTFVANLPPDFHNKKELQQAIPVIKGVVGAKVLKNWNFDDDFIKVALFSNDWYQNHADQLSLTDIVVLSRLHYKMCRNKTANIPAVTSIPASSKLKNIALSPENTLKILHDAKHRINDALKTFAG